MDISISIVIQSHLSDALIEMQSGETDLATLRIRFAKFLSFHHFSYPEKTYYSSEWYDEKWNELFKNEPEEVCNG